MPFAPTDVTGLKLWADFSDISTLFTDSARTTPVASDGDPIGGVTDKSGVNNHLGQATSGNRPLYKTNVKNALSVSRFDGTNDSLLSSTFTALTQPNELWIVCKKRLAAGNQQIFDNTTGSGNRNTLGYHDTTPSIQNVRCFAGNVITSGGSFDTTQFLLIHTYYNGASGFIEVNGYFAATQDIGSGSMDGFALGDATATVPLDGDICEVCFYNATVSGGDRTSLKSYFATKWGLSFGNTGWWTSGGIAASDCLGAWDYISAANFGASQINLCNGINPTGGTAPSQTPGTGLTFNGSTQYVQMPQMSGPTISAIIRLANGPASAVKILYGTQTGSGGFQIYPRFVGTDNFTTVQGTVITGTNDGPTAGVVALTPTGMYLNGSLDNSITPDWTGIDSDVNFLGGANHNGSLDFAWNGDVCAIALYKIDIAANVAALTTAMNALPVSGASLAARFYYATVGVSNV